MTKIIASVLTLSLAFAAGVVLGARNSQPKIKKIASFSSKPLQHKAKQPFLAKKKTPQAKFEMEPKPKETQTADFKHSKGHPVQANSFLNKKRTGYTVLLSSFKVENNAQNYAQKIAKKGYDAFYFSKDIKGKVWHRVGVGSFSIKSTAESLKKQLTENRLGKGSVISKIPQNKSI